MLSGLTPGESYRIRLHWATFSNSGSGRSNLGAKIAEAGLEYVDNTLELFSQEGGDEWWLQNGNECPAYFFLQEDSACFAALYAYLEEKGVEIDGRNETGITTAEDQSDSHPL
jgi:hypothetical protein